MVGSCHSLVHSLLLDGRLTLSGTMQPAFDIYFQRLASETAIILPSSPIKVTALRSPAVLQLWWAQAKRHAFRKWSYLINSPTGIFLVTKAIKTSRYAHCLSRGTPGEVSQIRVHGSKVMPTNSTDLKLPRSGTRWVPIRNDLGFELEDSGEKGAYTIFIERETSRLFALTDPSLKDEAQSLWRYQPLFEFATRNCLYLIRSSCAQSASQVLPPAGSPLPLPGCPAQNNGIPTWVQPLQATQDPFAQDLMSYWHAYSLGPTVLAGSFATEPSPQSGSNPDSSDWAALYNVARIRTSDPIQGCRCTAETIAPSLSVQKLKFDGRDRLCLEEGWALIKGENAFFLEMAGNGLDPSKDLLSTPQFHNLLTTAAGCLLGLLRKARLLCRGTDKDSRCSNTVPGIFPGLPPRSGSVPVAMNDMSFRPPFITTDQISAGHLSTMSLPVPVQLTTRPAIPHYPLIGFPWPPQLSSVGSSISSLSSNICCSQTGPAFSYPASCNASNSPIAFEIPWGWN